MTEATVRAALSAGAARLAAAGVPDPARDARRLMAAALGVAPDRLTLLAGDPMTTGAAEVFARMLGERERRRPVAQIVGRRSFWGREFTVTAAVLDPRPETEALVEFALAGGPAARLLDIGTGSGAILLTLLAEWPEAAGVGTDIDPAALAVAATNAGRLGVAARARLLATSWADGIGGRFDLVVSNPPYIAAAEVEALAPDVRDWEPRHALTPGPDGLESYAAIAPALPGLLAPGGRALFEIGPTQAAAVSALLAGAGLAGIAVHPDLDGRDRVVSASLPG
ncbi:MAG: peptide chain release factor N(5)-glutamine methyltransferase [Amaricoccus sp.]|uniref:peptide chain release factor N(5)-glutamine methyltransferase n=1 Tax=Amaricoccus sp. TaxID=1872485 RepID=UPI0039E40352